MKNFLIALQFMTRIPVSIKTDYDERELGSSTKYFPLVGLIIGLLLALVYKLGSIILPPLVIGALIIITEVALTGGLHLDGFMDTMDGLLSSRPKEEAFKIMKDSRVGAHSVTALVALMILKYSILVSLPKVVTPFYLFIMPLVGRWMLLYCLAFFPYAKNEGLGKIFWQYTSKKHWFTWTLFLLILTSIFLPYIQVFSILLTYLILLSFALKIVRFLGGHTGDTYGAINEITEVVFLLICLILSKL